MSSTVSALSAVAFGADPGRWPLPSATDPDELWLRAVAAGGQGRYASARADLAELAQQRAEGLRDALVEAGVETARITVVGKGSDEPSDTSGTDVGMSKNRRVEVELVP